MKWINAMLLILVVLLCSSAGAEEGAAAEGQWTTVYSFADESCGAWTEFGQQ